MKLKRIISVLVVFTLVMTCAVCSVSAATYKTSTSYSVGSDDVTIRASFEGVTPDAEVSYILYTGDEPTEDTIIQIDQVTAIAADADGNGTYAEVTLPKDVVKGAKFQFTDSEGNVLEPWTNGAADYRNSVNAVRTIDDRTLGINFISDNIRATSGNPYVCYMGSNGKLVRATIQDYIYDDFNGPAAAKVSTKNFNNKVFTVPLDAQSVAIQFQNKSGRAHTRIITLKKLAGTFSGNELVSESSVVYDSKSSSKVNKLTGNVYKDSITDGEFAGMDIEGGCVIALHSENDTSDKTYQIASIDRLPIMEKVTKNGKEYDSLTFLVTAKSITAAESWGIKVIQYSAEDADIYEPAGGSGNPEGTVIGYFDSVTAPAGGNDRFAIQLVDEAETGIFNRDNYYYVAVPYFKKADGSTKYGDPFGQFWYTVTGNEAGATPTYVEAE